MKRSPAYSGADARPGFGSAWAGSPLLLVVAAVLLFALPPPAHAEETARLAAIDALVQEIADAEAELERLTAEVDAADPESSERASLAEAADARRHSLEALRNDLVRVGSGVSPQSLDDVGDGEPMELEAEVRDLLSPVFVELRSATARPRRIEALRGAISRAEDRIATVDAALANLDELDQAATSEQSREAIRALIRSWSGRKEEYRSQIRIAAAELEELTEDERSFLEIAQETLHLFVRERGRSSMLALAAFVFTLLFFVGARRSLVAVLERRGIRGTSFGTRFAELALAGAAVLGALVATIGVLYLEGDWLLLVVLGGVLLIVLWALRETVPRMWAEARLLLNIGPVRQGHRVEWRGLPWEVRTLSFVTVLRNPAMPSPELVPLRRLLDMESRPFDADEPWFPARIGDHVRFRDGLRGPVLALSPEFVRLRTQIGERTLTTRAFVEAAPENLSRGFGIRWFVRLDPTHRVVAGTAVPEALQAMAEEVLGAHPAETISTRLTSVEPGELVVKIEAYFDGAAAPDYGRIQDAVQAGILATCVAQGWSLAVPRLSLRSP